MKHLTLGEATWFLVILAAAVVGLTTYEVARGTPMAPAMFVPAGLMLAILAAWPFLNGWRPFTPAGAQLRSCNACGLEWRPNEEDGITQCPACAGHVLPESA